MNEKFEKIRYEVHCKSHEGKDNWITLHRTAITFGEAERQIINHKKSNKTIDSFISIPKTSGYRIVKVESKCEVIKTYENRTA